VKWAFSRKGKRGQTRFVGVVRNASIPCFDSLHDSLACLRNWSDPCGHRAERGTNERPRIHWSQDVGPVLVDELDARRRPITGIAEDQVPLPYRQTPERFSRSRPVGWAHLEKITRQRR
jgi:hypothetical protein